jgi:hypothetical protein
MPFKSTNLHNQNLALRTCQLCHLGPYPFTVCKKPLFFILFYLCILLWSSPPSQCQHPRRLQRSCAPLTLCPNVAACDRPSPHVVRRSREAPIYRVSSSLRPPPRVQNCSSWEYERKHRSAVTSKRCWARWEGSVGQRSRITRDRRGRWGGCRGKGR